MRSKQLGPEKKFEMMIRWFFAIFVMEKLQVVAMIHSYQLPDYHRKIGSKMGPGLWEKTPWKSSFANLWLLGRWIFMEETVGFFAGLGGF